jgi:hypothetical protein
MLRARLNWAWSRAGTLSLQGWENVESQLGGQGRSDMLLLLSTPRHACSFLFARPESLGFLKGCWKLLKIKEMVPPRAFTKNPYDSSVRSKNHISY